MGGFTRTESDIQSARANKRIFSFNINTKEWNYNLPDIRYPRGHIASLIHENEIYLMGGINKYEGYYQNDSIDVFNPATGEWREVDALKGDRLGSTACIIGNKIYLIGGAHTIRTKFKAMDHNEVYDLDSLKWTSLQKLPFPVAYSTAIPVNQYIYLIGGDSDVFKPPEPIFLRFDIEKNKWDQDFSKASFMGSVGVCRYGEYFYVFGGRAFASFEDQGGYTGLDKVYMYDLAEDFWLEIAKMPFGLWTLQVREIDGRIYLVGGKHCLDLDYELKAGYFPSIYTYIPARAPIYSKKTAVSKYSLLSVQDSTCITARIIDHYDYDFQIYAELKGEISGKSFEAQLFDDGKHNDGNANDTVYAGYFKHPGIEDIFDISIVSNNLDLDEKFYSGQDCRSICTIGPMEISDYKIISRATTVNGELLINFYLDLVNTGKHTPANGLSIELFAFSDSIKLLDRASDFNTIKPGETGRSKSEFSISILPGQYSSKAKILASISLDGYSYWNQELVIPVDW